MIQLDIHGEIYVHTCTCVYIRSTIPNTHTMYMYVMYSTYVLDCCVYSPLLFPGLPLVWWCEDGPVSWVPLPPLLASGYYCCLAAWVEVWQQWQQWRYTRTRISRKNLDLVLSVTDTVCKCMHTYVILLKMHAPTVNWILIGVYVQLHVHHVCCHMYITEIHCS